MKRPQPPNNLGQFDGSAPVNFCVAMDMPLWVKQTFLDPESKLHNKDHEHLIDAIDGDIGFLWSATGYEAKGRYVLGQTEELLFRCNKWQKWRQEQQMTEWFGINLPQYVITLDASYCAQCSDIDFCALLEHELYHIGQEKAFGQPKFHRDTGLPKLKLVGHDVEEFVGVVRRYGMNSQVAKLVEAANKKPEVAKLDIAHACGTCLKLVA